MATAKWSSNPLFFMESEVYPEPATGPYPEQDDFSPLPDTISLISTYPLYVLDVQVICYDHSFIFVCIFHLSTSATCLLSDHASQVQVSLLLQEGMTMYGLSHSNVLSVLGVSIEDHTAPFLIYPHRGDTNLKR